MEARGKGRKGMLKRGREMAHAEGGGAAFADKHARNSHLNDRSRGQGAGRGRAHMYVESGPAFAGGSIACHVLVPQVNNLMTSL